MRNGLNFIMPRLLLVIAVMLAAGLGSPRAADLLATHTNLPLCFTPALTKWQETARFHAAPSAQSGVRSRKRIPGWGQSGIVRTQWSSGSSGS